MEHKCTLIRFSDHRGRQSGISEPETKQRLLTINAIAWQQELRDHALELEVAALVLKRSDTPAWRRAQAIAVIESIARQLHVSLGSLEQDSA